MTNEEEFLPTIQTIVQNGFRDLLSHKHLYQTVRLPKDEIKKVAEQLLEEALRWHDEDLAIEEHLSPDTPHLEPPSIDDFLASAEQVLALEWQPRFPELRQRSKMIFPDGGTPSVHAVEFELPTIRTTCGECKKDEPFNPVQCDIPTTHGLDFNGSTHEQNFVLRYQCQNCKGRPVTFLVRRSKDKLILCGREPMEIVTVPADIPKAHKDHFSVAIVAHQTGQILCAIFMLRVFIEQYWLSFPTVHAAATTNRFSGETIGEEYKKLLPDAIKGSFPTLVETYGKLSAAIHEANADEAIYIEAKKKILKHFEALRTFDYDPAMAQSNVEPDPAP